MKNNTVDKTEWKEKKKNVAKINKDEYYTDDLSALGKP